MKVINPGTEVCRDAGRPGCLETPDPAYTMRFDDIGEGPILWCSHCGPDAHRLQALLETMPLEKLVKVYDKLEETVAKAKAKGN